MAWSPALWGEDIAQVLNRTATDITETGVGWDQFTGHGIVNAERALGFTAVRGIEQGIAANVYDAGEQTLTMSLWEVPGLSDGTYFVKRHEMRARVTFSTPFFEVPQAWGRSYQSVGWSDRNPHYDLEEPVGWSEVIPESTTSTGCVLRTFVYEIGPNWYPTTRENARMAWTAIGLTTLTGVSDATTQPPLRVWAKPNPAPGSCTLGFSLPTRGGVTLSVYDVRGRLVRQLVSGEKTEGTHSAVWDLRDVDQRPVGSGIYFYRLETALGETNGKMAVLR